MRKEISNMKNSQNEDSFTSEVRKQADEKLRTAVTALNQLSIEQLKALDEYLENILNEIKDKRR